MPAFKFYDDYVREALAVWADAEFQARLWMGLEPGLVGSPSASLCHIFTDTGLDRALEAGDAYGEPTDGLLRQIDALTTGWDLDLFTIEELERDERFTESRRLAAQALATLEGRPLGTVRGQALDPL